MLKSGVALTALAALVVASSAGAAVFTIRGDWRMGSFAVKKDGTLGGAVEAFGQPGAKVRNGEVCTVRWSRHGLRIVFYNLGGRNPCSGKFGFFSNARARGPHWVTNRGLAIGDRERRLENRYPNAKFHPAERGFWPAGWWLVRRRSQFGTGGFYPGLLAHMHNRRVQAFHVRFPAGGD
ncbi:MAG TPA: hypothetical protein VH281_05710 [Gaiellaceae bacterium]